MANPNETPAPGMFGKPRAPDLTATGILDAAAQHMRDRAATYDQPGGERSAGKIADAFNAITGRAAERAISESEAWLFLVILKLVRDRSRALPHPDSLEDSVAYASLMAEARFKEVPVPQALRDAVKDDEPVLSHADLRKTYVKGQSWQYKKDAESDWGDCVSYGLGGSVEPTEPNWVASFEYRLKPNVVQPVEQPHAELRKTYLPGQQWEFKLQSASEWSVCFGEPLWTESTTYRLKPDVAQPVEQPQSPISLDQVRVVLKAVQVKFGDSSARTVLKFAGDCLNARQLPVDKYENVHKVCAMLLSNDFKSNFEQPAVQRAEQPHADLRKIYRPGQRWECLPFSDHVWGDCVTWCDDTGSRIPAEPKWDASTQYRLKTAV